MSDFFDNFGKAITETAEDLGKRLEDTVEIQKYKSKIRSLKRANERDMIEIGKNCYHRFKNGEVADMDSTTLCESIERREEEIENCRESIKSIRE